MIIIFYIVFSVIIFLAGIGVAFQLIFLLDSDVFLFSSGNWINILILIVVAILSGHQLYLMRKDDVE